MCQFKSFICTEKRLYVHVGLDSHENIIDLYDLKDDPEKIVRVELVPPEFTLKAMKNVDSWTFNTDQDIIPKWFIEEEWDKECRKWMKKNIIFDNKKIIADRIEVFCGKCEIVINGFINICFGSVGELSGNSSVGELWGNSSVGELWGNSSVGVLWRNSSVDVLKGNSSVGELWENSSVGVLSGNSSVGELWGNSSVGELWGNSSVGELWGNSSVGVLWGNSKIIKDNRIKEAV